MNGGAASTAAIDALLPQTQCRQCGFPGCRPYAEALAAGAAAINRCPPGGTALIAELAALLGTAPLPPDPAHGAMAAPAVAVIDESACIGCALCLPACPVDAIVGAPRLMHTVISAECTGCGLCLPPCPVDCITLVATGIPGDRTAQRAAASRLRQRFEAHQQRQAAGAARKRSKAAATRKQAVLARALARARARLGKTPE